MTDEQDPEYFTLERVVLKDLSFETPMGSAALTSDLSPDYTVNLRLNSNRAVTSKLFEIVVTATITAKLEAQTAYVIEVQQAGIFKFADLQEREPLRRIAAVDAPKWIFPYLRETVDNILTKGGFPPIGLQPPDFAAWYEEAKLAADSSEDEGQRE